MIRSFWLALGAMAVAWPAGSTAAGEQESTESRPSQPAVVVVSHGPISSQPRPVPPEEAAAGQVPAADVPGPSVTLGALGRDSAAGLVAEGCGVGAEDRGGHFVAGGGFYYIRPRFENNPAFAVQYGPGLAAGWQRDFDWDARFAPIVWLGYVGDNGLSIRSRYWRFEQSTIELAANTDFTGNVLISSASPLGLNLTSPSLVFFKQGVDTLAFDSKLTVDAIDLEGTWECGVGRWCVLLASGARYAQVGQEYNAFRNDPPSGQGAIPGCNPSSNQPKKCDALTPPPPPPGGGPGGAPSGSGVNSQLIPVLISQDFDVLRSGHRFSGAGPTFAAEARRRLADTGLAVYLGGRCSVLFGRSTQGAELLGVLEGAYVVAGGANIPFSARTFDRLREGRDLVMPVVECEVGAEWGRDWGRTHLFAQTALVHQTWFGAGDASSDRGQLGFFGLSFTAGMSY